jgi:hypothetical protein
MHSKLLLTALSVLVFAVASVRGAEDDTALLNTLGYTTGQSVLITHMAVGTLADAFVGKAYKTEQATTFVNTYINITKGLKEQMSKLVAADTLSKNDAKFIANTIEVLDLVIEEAKDLKTYIESGDKTDAAAYEKSRKAALKEIKTLLGMKD